MGDHLVEGGIGILRLLDADDLDLVELVQAVQATHVLAVRTGLAAEARSVCRKLLWETVILEDDIPEDVGHRHFSGRDEEKSVQSDDVHLGLLVRKLACTEAGCSVDQHRRFDLLVAGGGIEIEEIVDQSPLQLCTLALIDRESGSRELDSEVEVDDVILLGKLPVRKSVLRKMDFRASGLDDLVVFGALARHDQVARHIRKQDYLGVEFLVVLIRLGEKL